MNYETVLRDLKKLRNLGSPEGVEKKLAFLVENLPLSEFQI